jgi:hypothetical protein
MSPEEVSALSDADDPLEPVGLPLVDVPALAEPAPDDPALELGTPMAGAASAPLKPEAL